MKIEFPTLARPVDYSPTIPIPQHYQIERKWDGIRLVVIKDDSGIRFLTRSQQDITAKLQYLHDALSDLPNNSLLDGELALSFNGKREELGNIQRVIGSTAERANQIVSEIGYPIFHPFDILWYAGKETAVLPLRKRLWYLEEVESETEYMMRSEATETQLIPDAFDTTTAAGAEGIVIKDLERPYGDSYWIRWKSVKTVDLVVKGFNPPSGRYKDRPVTGSLQGYLYDPQTKCFKRAASIYGLSDQERSRFYRLFTENPEAQVVVEAKYSHRFPSGGFRFCSFLRTRDDKWPEECRI
jgi:DNA ligase-1